VKSYIGYEEQNKIIVIFCKVYNIFLRRLFTFIFISEMKVKTLNSIIHKKIEIIS
jgi:hypothetical protein